MVDYNAKTGRRLSFLPSDETDIWALEINGRTIGFADVEWNVTDGRWIVYSLTFA